MKRFLGICMGLALAFGLAFPIHSMAGTVNIQTSDGYNVLVNKPYNGFFIDGSGNLSIMLNATSTDLPQSLQCDPYITISGSNANNATGIVTGTAGSQVTFTVSATSAEGTPAVSCLSDSTANPSSHFQNGTYAYSFPSNGTYLVVFQASVTDASTPPETYATQRVVQVVIGSVCQSTVTAAASGTGGTITGATSQTVPCGNTANFSGTLTSGATAQVSEGSYSCPNGLNWTWGVTAPTTSGQTKNVTITFSSGTPSCTSQVTAVVTNPAGGSITSTNPVSTTCGSPVSFSGTYASGYTGGSATEGTFTPNGLYWNLTNVTAPATSGGYKTVNITFTGPTPPPGNCTTQDMTSRISSAVPLNHLNSDGTYGYTRYATHYVSAGSEVWYLVDPASVNASGNALDVSIVNFGQGDTISKWAVYRVNQNNCLVDNGPIITDSSCMNDWCGFGELFKPFSGYFNGYPTGRKYLFNVGVRNSVGLAAFWKLSTN